MSPSTPLRQRHQENRGLIATELDKTMMVEAAAGTGKTTELVGRIVALIEHQRATHRRDRRGDVQREGRRRAQAAAARRARTRAREGMTAAKSEAGRLLDAGRARLRRSARQHHSRLLRRAAPRAAGRGARRSRVRRPDRLAGRAHLRRGVHVVAARAARRIPAKACGDRCGGRSGGGRTTRRETGRSSACARPRATCASGATTPRRGRGPSYDRTARHQDARRAAQGVCRSDRASRSRRATTSGETFAKRAHDQRRDRAAAAHGRRHGARRHLGRLGSGAGGAGRRRDLPDPKKGSGAAFAIGVTRDQALAAHASC